MASQPSHSHGYRAPGRVLVVEDDRCIARLLEVNLVKMGCEVVCAFDGVEAIEKLGGEDFDAVILDLILPRLDGLEVLRRVRAHPHPDFDYLPIIVLTAKANERDIYESYHAGADIHLTKPFNMAELLKVLGF